MTPLAQIAVDRRRNFTTRRFRGESVAAHRLRVGLSVPRRPRGLSRWDCLRAGLCALGVFVACVWLYACAYL